jgi:hypothetical protein
MKTTRPILVLIAVMFVSGFVFCEKNKLQVDLTEVLSIGSLNDDALFMWADIKADPADGMYVTDTMDYSLKHFSHSGELLKKQGRKGQGPGEFLAPRSLEITEKYIYVTDQYLTGIHVFNRTDLEFLRVIPFQNPISEFEVISEDKFAVIPTSLSAVGKVVFLDTHGNKMEGFTYWDSGKVMLLDAVSFNVDTGGSFYMAYNFQDRIEKFDPQGRRIWSTSLLGVKKVKKEKVNRFTVPTEIVYLSIALDEQGRIYVLGGKMSDNPHRDVYILDPSGEWVGTFTLPQSSHCIHIDGDNYLYSRGNSGVTIKKYRLSLN